MSDEIEQKIHNLIVELFKLDPTQLPEILMADTIPAWDSVGHMDLINQLEKEFNIELPFAQSVELLTALSITEAVRILLKK